MNSEDRRIVLVRFKPGWFRGFRPVARVWNTLLPVLSIGTFAGGCLAFLVRRPALTGKAESLAAMLGAYLALALLHEGGHLNANLAYGQPVEELGILFHPLGLYVLSESSQKKSRYIQTCMAGIETDLLSAGVLLWYGAFTGSRFCIWLALTNFLSALCNALPDPCQNDGTMALTRLLDLGETDIFMLARRTLGDPRASKELLDRGANGRKALMFLRIVQFGPTASILLQAAQAIFSMFILL